MNQLYKWNIYRRYNTRARLGSVQAATKEQAISEANTRHGFMIDVDLDRRSYVTALATRE